MSSRRRRRTGLISSVALLTGASLVVSATNWGLNLLLSRLLTPAQFGDATLAMSFVLVSALLAATVQMSAAAAVARSPRSARRTAHALAGIAGAAGVAIAGVTAISAPAMTELLGVESPWMIVVLAIGLPIYVVQAVYRGVALGQERFVRLASSYLVEAGVRVVFSVALAVVGLGAVGVAIGLTLSFAASGFVVRASRAVMGDEAVPWDAVRRTAGGAAVLLCAQVIINNTDIVLAKLHFAPTVAGIYAAAAVLGRAVFFFSWALAQAVFPRMVAGAGDAGERYRALVRASVVVAVFAGTAAVAATFGAEEMIAVAFGIDYAAAAPLLAPYVLSCGLFALSNLWATADVAQGASAGPAILLAGAAGQAFLLTVFGSTPSTMVWLQVAAMLATALALAVRVLIGIHLLRKKTIGVYSD